MGVHVQEIEAKELKQWLDKGEVVLVDVREHLEYAEEHLAQAQLFPMSRFIPENIPIPSGKKLVFYCHLGRRSHVAARRWAEVTGISESHSLKGGIEGWKGAGFNTIVDRAVEHKIERQGYMGFGLLVILGTFLAVFINSAFWIFPLLIGILLMVSGYSGHCYLSIFLSKLPSNK